MPTCSESGAHCFARGVSGRERRRDSHLKDAGRREKEKNIATHEYECEHCGHHFGQMQLISAPPLTVCLVSAERCEDDLGIPMLEQGRLISNIRRAL